MKQRELCAGALVLGLIALALSGWADYHSLVYLAGGTAGLLLLMKLLSASSHWKPLALCVAPKLALSVTAIFVSALIAEATLQLCCFNYFPRLSGGYRNAFDRTLGWLPVPNDREPGDGPPVANNSLGFRGDEFHRAGKVGIMFLGDSFVWGYAIRAPEDRFTDKIQAKHPEWNIYNVGVIGYGTDQELLLLKRVFDKLNPRVVFLVFCTENDHKDNTTSISYGCYKPYFTTNAAGLHLGGVPVPCSENLYCAAHPLLSRSYLFRLVVRVWKKFTLPRPVVNDDPTPALILEMRKYLQAKGASFAVGLTAPDPQIQRLLQRCGIPSLDLNTIYRRPGDYHWTRRGNAVVAERIERFLMTNNALCQALSPNIEPAGLPKSGAAFTTRQFLPASDFGASGYADKASTKGGIGQSSMSAMARSSSPSR